MSDSSDSDFNDLAAALGSFKDDVKDDDSSDSEDEKVPRENTDSEEEQKPVHVKKSKRRKMDPEEQKELNKFLFGDKEGLIKNLEGNQLFFTDVTGEQDGGDSQKQGNEAAWHDSDDDDFKRKRKDGETILKRKFERIAGIAPSWAQLDKKKEPEDSDDEDDKISKTVGHIAKKSASKELLKGDLSYKRLKNVNKTTMFEGRITSVEFHPHSTVGIVAGLHGIVSMFALDGRENKK